jgi:thiamine-phosphate pyrophosphorylase
MAIEDWGLYLVTGEELSAGRSTRDVVAAAIEGGASVVQLREKSQHARRRYDIGREVRAVTADAGVDFVVNDRVDLAMALDADGVHLGQEDLPVSVARELLGESAIVGCSVSTVPEARSAVEAGADYLGVGTVFATGSKDVADERVIGLAGLRAIRGAVDLPLVAIGGIDAENARAVVEAGADAVAVISAVTQADDVAAAARELAAVLDRLE